MSTYIDDPRYPDWLICAGFNELYYTQFGGSFWESGLKSGHPEEFMGLHPEDHKNFIMESQAYTLSGNINVGAGLLELGTSTGSTGTLTYSKGNIIGSFKRWFNLALG